MKITRKQLIELCVKFSKSDNVKFDRTNAYGYSYDSHLILLKRGIEVCRISLMPNKGEPYTLRLGNNHYKITTDDKDWNKVIGCFNESQIKFPTYKKILELL